MPETEKIVFTFSEVADALIQKGGLHEGLWGIYIQFGLQGSNVGLASDQLSPAAIVPILKIGLQRFDKPNNLTADAAVVNPSQKES